MRTKVWMIMMVLALAAGLVAGCGTEATTESGAVTGQEQTGNTAESASGSEDTAESYEDALPVNSQLALGTLMLAETANSVTPEQAASLLPLWQVIEAGSLQGEAETSAIMRQIEKAMSDEQLAAIAAMQLTGENLSAWAQEQGVRLAGPGGGAEGFAPPEGMTEEEMAEMRAARQAGGEGGFAPPEGMTEEEREAMRATAEASGMTRPGDASGMGGEQLAVIATPLVEMLQEVAES